MKVVLEERDNIMGKICTQCLEWQPLTNFTTKNGKSLGGVDSKCRPCRNEIKRNSYLKKNNGSVRKLRTYSDEELLSFAKKNYFGKTNTQTREYKRTVEIINRRYGSMGEVYKLLGLEGEARRGKWNSETIKTFLLNYSRKNKSVKLSDFSKEYSGLYKACIEIFGTWENTLLEVGFDPDSIKYKKPKKVE